MAIQFARLQYVKRSVGQSVCHKAAYNGRLEIHDNRLEKTFRYGDKTDGAHHEILLPDGVSEKYRDPSVLWNTVEAVEERWDSQVGKEMVLALPDDASISLQDRIVLTNSFVQKHFVKHGIICQVDIHGPSVILDKGDEGASDRGSISHNNAGSSYLSADHRAGDVMNGSSIAGLAPRQAADSSLVEVDLSPGEVNWHAHVLMPTRPCQGEVFGKKARHLDVDVRGGRVVSNDRQWGRLWAQHQNDYFKEKNIDLRVDPVGLVPNIHLGPVRMRGDRAPSVMQRSMTLHEESRLYAQQEDLVLRYLTREQATFTKEDVDHFVGKHIDLPAQEDFKQRFYESSQLILVGQDQYTSRAVLDEERRLLRMADRLANRTADAPFSTAKEMYERVVSSSASGAATQVEDPLANSVTGSSCSNSENRVFNAGNGSSVCDASRLAEDDDLFLTQAQQKAFDHVIKGSNLTLIEGMAGSGKTHVLGALKDVYAQAGYTVRGFASQACLVAQMKQDGFSHAAHVRRFLFKQYYEREAGLGATDESVWINPGKEVWLVDGATTVANPDMTELLDLAWMSNVKVVLCGDVRQSPCQGRGGAFAMLQERYGSLALDDHSRQQEDAQKQIVAMVAQGQAGKALDQMEALGIWHHHAKESGAIQDLLSCWYVRYQNAPENSFMILEHRQPYVRVFNEKIHDVLKSRGDVDMNEFSIDTAKHGVMKFSAGDALVFMQDNEDLGVATGLRGTLIHATQDCFTVRISDQRNVMFDPQVYNNFQHGYAGLIYSAQGQTFDHVFVSHSKHVDAEDFYVACSRHVLSCDYFSSGDRDAVRSVILGGGKAHDRGSIDLNDAGSSQLNSAHRYCDIGNGSSISDAAHLVEDDGKGGYLDDCVALICDAFCKDHDYYRHHDYTRAPSYGRDDLQKELMR